MAAHAGPNIIEEGLVLCLDAGNERSYPGSGTTWYDLSGNNGHHTLYSASLTTVDGVQCMDVSSSGKYIANPSTAFTFGSSHTLIAWARPLADSQVSTWRTLWRTTADDHPLLIQNNSNTIGYYDNNVAGFVSYGLNLGTLGLENIWAMFSLVSNGTTTTLYINEGTTSGSVNYTTAGNSQDAFGNTDGGSQPFGYVSVGQIYNRALTANEVAQNFAALRGRYGI